MELNIFWFLICLICSFIEYLDSTSVSCKYDVSDFHAVGVKYRCLVQNDLKISSPESAEIDEVTGAHANGKTSDSEIYFYVYDKPIEYFPRGLGKFFTNLTGIVIATSQLREIRQKDLKPYSKLTNLYLTSNNIEVIEDDLFDFNPNIEVIIFYKLKIFHISPTVFDKLNKLTTLHLGGNKCVDKSATNNRTGVLEVIKEVKNKCTSSDFLKLDEKLKKLEENFNLKIFSTFKENLENFLNELKNSKFSNTQNLKRRLNDLSDWKFEIIWEKIIVVEDSLKKSNNETVSKVEKVQVMFNDSIIGLKMSIDKELLNTSGKIISLEKSVSEYKNITAENVESVQNNLKTAIETSIMQNKAEIENIRASQNSSVREFKVALNDLKTALNDQQSEVQNYQKISINEVKSSMNKQNNSTNDQIFSINDQISTLNGQLSSFHGQITALDKKMDKLEKVLTDSMTKALNQHEVNMTTFQSDMSAEINGTWKLILFTCCTFLFFVLIFIACKIIWFRVMSRKVEQKDNGHELEVRDNRVK